MNAEILRFENANTLYYGLVDRLKAELAPLLNANRDPTIALPTGNTMIPFYKIASEQETELGIRHWNCFNLDEYYPIPHGLQNESFKHYLDHHFYS